MRIEFHIPEDSPTEELIRLGQELISEGIVAPGFIPPGRGALDPFALHFMRTLEGRPVTMFVDLNIVSEIATIASGAADRNLTSFGRSVGKLMAVCLFNDILLDPSLAIHEQAQTKGHEHAKSTLEWFRAGDNASAWDWLEIARGTTRAITAVTTPAGLPGQLDKPIERFRRNYLLALKIAELEVSTERKPLDRLTEFIEWMQEHMYWAGAAALFAAMYLSPQGPKAGLMSRLRSPDRRAALDGIRRQAWDLSHLSEFGRSTARVGDDARLLFATKDQGLSILANLISVFPSESEIADVLSFWWRKSDAGRISQLYSRGIEAAEAARGRESPLSRKSENWIADTAIQLEHSLVNWTP